MKLKIGKNFVNLILIVLLTMNSMFFYFPPVMDLFLVGNTYHKKAFSLMIIVILVMLTVKKLRTSTIKINMLDFSIILLNCIVALTLLIQIIQGRESIVGLLENTYYIFISLLYFPLKFFYLNNYFVVIKIFTTIGILFAFSNLTIYFMVKLGLWYPNQFPLIQWVNGNLRLPQSADLIGLTCILCFYCFIETKKIKFFFLSIFCISILVFISNVRMATLVVTISMVLMYLFDLKRKQSSKKFYSMVVIVILSIFLLLLTFIMNGLSVIDYFLGEGQRLDSALYRIVEIKHYSNYFFENLIFGFGATNDVSVLQYALTDIGIFGFTFKYGLLGVFWFGVLLYSFYKSIKFSKNPVLVIGMVSYFLISFISLSLLDSQRILYFPIIMFLIYVGTNYGYLNSTKEE